ncbi:transcriptional regulatory protein [Spirochaeta thermophila DSM 6192]|uniref:Transcriptional regulatory protein n=1 Tax=Winmispira thermophila (strain ATCC 49972 / DSM 6192 / RI 19.B1) TaxID=665571 RepID=E0RQT5_WINT6|nr:transcriptional regulatory protein [Spirochaeta thermophila DSM 6192]
MCVYDNAEDQQRAPEEQGRVTIREIARRAGVSIGTVDRVLHNRGRVAPETRKRVEALIEELGYTPNPIARHLKRRKGYLFYVFLPRKDEDSGYWRLICKGVHRAAEELGPFGIQVRFVEYDRYSGSSFSKAAETIPFEGCDGLLLAPVRPADSLALLQRLPSHLPFVFFDATIPHVRPLTSIMQDPFAGGFLAGKLLYLFGMGRPGTYCVIGPHGEDFHIRRRIEGFQTFWQAKGRDFRILVRTCEDLDHKRTREAFLTTLFEEIPDPRGIFVANASVHRVAEVVNRSGGRHVPIVGYDLVPENERLLREGKIDALISQRPAYQGYQAVYQLYRKVVLQQHVPASIPVPLHIYMKENLPAGAVPDLEYEGLAFASE